MGIEVERIEATVESRLGEYNGSLEVMTVWIKGMMRARCVEDSKSG